MDRPAPLPRHYTSPTDLAQLAVIQYNLRVTCTGCGGVSVIDGVALWWRFEQRGWRNSLREVGRRLACERCYTARGVRVRWPTIEIVREHPTRADLAIPDERTWKRLVARYRT